MPGSPDFFDAVLRLRSTSEMPWLTRLVPFREMVDRDVLEVGCGAGYDAYEFLRHGARYVGVDITPENIDRTRSHLRSKGLIANGLRVADAMDLPYMDRSFDVVFSNGVLHHVEDTAGSLKEAFRVLRPGGDLWITLYHRDSAFHWLTLYLYLWILRGRRRSYRLVRRVPLDNRVHQGQRASSGSRLLSQASRPDALRRRVRSAAHLCPQAPPRGLAESPDPSRSALEGHPRQRSRSVRDAVRVVRSRTCSAATYVMPLKPATEAGRIGREHRGRGSTAAAAGPCTPPPRQGPTLARVSERRRPRWVAYET